MVLAALLLPHPGVAMWAQWSDDELIQRSDLIVVGTWIGQTGVSLSTGPVDAGAISVSEVLKGLPAQSLALVVMPSAKAPQSSSDIRYRNGDHGLWLLRVRPGPETGFYLADHPQRFVPASTGAARIETLRRALRR